MKRLLIALAAAVTVSTASAIITDTQLFETSHDFEADVPAEDSSAITAYESGAQPSFTAPYPCSSYGDNFLKLDTGDATLWRTNISEAADIYFDMAIQFTPTAEGDEPDPAGNKIVVFMDAETNIVVISGTDAIDHTPVTNRFPAADYNLAAKSWARLTIAAVQGNGAILFNVLVNETPLQRSFFYSLDSDTLVREVGFSGSGAVDDFVARTTDPYLDSWSAMIGPGEGEKYATYSDALVDALASTTAGAASVIAFIYNNETNYVDGTAERPYQIPNVGCLLALQDAVIANPAVRSLNFVQTANIDMTGVEGFYGIGWFASSTAYLSLPAGVEVLETKDGQPSKMTSIPFAGVYDGAGYTISNVTLVRHNYAGVFNCVEGTVKNLTVQDIGFNDVVTASADGGDLEWGCAIVGNAQGNAVLESLIAQTTSGFDWGNTPNHNAAGIVIRAAGATIVRACLNGAEISTSSTRLGGIAAFTAGASGDGVRILNCTNYMDLASSDGTRGVGGILGCAEAGTTITATTISGCIDYGSETAQAEGGHAGAIVGSNWNESKTYTDDGGNTFPAASPVCGYIKNPIFGLAYAIDAGIDGANYLTTVKQADLAANNAYPYVLLADVAASETPVFTLQAAGDTIAFNTNGFSFAGTVAASDPMVDVSSATDEYGVITYTAAQGTVVATITKGTVTNSYSTLQKAIAAADADPDADTVDLVANAAISGEVNIPSGVTVVLADGVSLANVTVLSGAGVLSVSSSEEVVGLVQTDHAANLLKDGDAWTGTLSIKNISLNGPDGLSYYGNTNSTVRMENVWLSKWTSSHAIGTLDLVGTGLYIVTMSGNMTFPCALTGDGPISVRDTCTTAAKVVFTGDVSGYTGNINLASSDVSVNFGSATTTSGGSIIVESGSVVTNVSTATWTANNLIVIGEMEANGTVNLGSTGKLWCNTGTGVYRANSTTAAVPVADSWNSTYVIGWAGSHSTAIDFDSYGNANSTIEIPEGSTLQGYIGSAQGGTYNLAAKEIVVNGVLDLSNGYNTSTVGWKKISGSGTVKFRFAPSTAIYEKITLLDGFSGSIEVSATTQLEIGTVNIAREPSADQLIVPLTVTSGGTVGGDLNLTVSGTASGTLEYKAAGANGEGLYVKASAPTVPIIYPSTSASAECGSAANATAAANAINATKVNYIKPPEGYAEGASTAEMMLAANAYANLFDARAEGTSVVVELNAAGTNALETTATNVAAQIVAPANLASILSSAGVPSINVTGVQPGFYYSVVYAETLSALSSAAEGDRGLATAAKVVNLPIPAPESGATTGFYRVLVNIGPKVTE